MKNLKNCFCFFLIFSFTFLVFDYQGVSAQDLKGYAQAKLPPIETTNKPTGLVTLDYKEAELSSVLPALP